MQFSLSILALAASLLSVNAESHSNLHRRTHARELNKRLIQANSRIQTLAAVGSPDVKEGKVDSMPYHNILVNNASVSAMVYFWKDMGFALPVTPYNPEASASAPLLVVNLAAGETKTVSFSDQFSGSYAPVYPDTDIGSGGNIKEAWVELTTKEDQYKGATVDVSYLPNMSGRWTAVEVDGCISDQSLCSFQCKNKLNTCKDAVDVELKNCVRDNDKSPYYQVKANYDYNSYWKTYNGGCFVSGTKKFITTFNSSR